MCPNCGRSLAYPVSQCQGGRCPFCGYKPANAPIQHDDWHPPSAEARVAELAKRSKEEAKRRTRRREEAKWLAKQRRIQRDQKEIEKAFADEGIEVDLRAYHGDRAFIVGTKQHVRAAIRYLEARSPRIEVVHNILKQ